MKRIIIVVEGQTEQEFVRQCLAPYLATTAGLFSVSARLLGKPGHKGGDMRYDRLKKDIAILLRETNTLVSTFIDYFKLQSDFPDFNQCATIADLDNRISALEQAINNDIDHTNFLSYIQKHEFEALLFSDTQRFKMYLTHGSCVALAQISQEYADPESINDKNPPSYRLDDMFRRYEPGQYNKVAFGNILALETGIDTMVARCPRFANWLTQLIEAAHAEK